MNKRMYLSIFLMIIVFQSCRTWVYVRSDNYMPMIERKFTSYNGRTICLAEVAHEASNADTWYYYSKYYMKTWYEAVPNVVSFFTESFRKTFVYIGMNICDPETSPGQSVMNIILLSLTDKEFRIKVNLVGKGITFSKVYIVKEPPPEKKNKEYLEQRAYRMVGKTVEAILGDIEFARAFFQTS